MRIEPENATSIGRGQNMRLAAKRSQQRSKPGTGMTSIELKAERHTGRCAVHTGRRRPCHQAVHGLTESCRI